MADQMVSRSHLDLSADGGALAEEGPKFLRNLGLDPDRMASRTTSRGRAFCRPRLDCSERRAHLAGAVGAALFQSSLDRDWLCRIAGTRALLVTPIGQLALQRAFDLPAGTTTL